MKKRSLAALLLALLAAVIFASPAMAAVPKRPENQYVLDSAKVLSEETEQKIIQENQRMFQEYGGEIVVVAVDFFGGESREDYANHIFNQWGIGSSERNNGLLLVLGIGEEDYYATAGSGIDDYFDGGTLDDMLYEYLEPDFAAEDYDAGVRKIFNALAAEMDTCCAGFTAGNGAPVGDNWDDWTQEDDETILWVVFAVLRVVVVVVVLLFIFSLLRRSGRGGGSGSGFAQGLFFGSMLGGRRRRWWGPPPPPPPPPGFGPGPRLGGFGGPRPGPRPGGPPPRGPRPPSGGFGGFGGSGRPGGFSGGGRSRGVGGGRSSFGGGRSGGFHGGGSSHGGGAGRRK